MLLREDEFFLIAEIGGNHEGDSEYARRLTDLAISSGADAIKYQIYSPDGLVNKILDENRHSHFRKFTLSFEEYEGINEFVLAIGERTIFGFPFKFN